MTEQARLRSLLRRLTNAVQHHCKRTARARARDIAKIYEEQKICSYEEKYNKLIEKYKL